MALGSEEISIPMPFDPPNTPKGMAHNLYKQVSVEGKDNTIRILQLSTNQKKPLEGYLEAVSLASNPSYYALSYRWGDYSDPPHRILCHAANSPSPVSAYVEITPNCCDALTQLRRDLAPYGWPRSFNIWVDAICINQDEQDKQQKLQAGEVKESQAGESEKQGQLPLMRTIYANAKRVYIWLGPETESSNYAMDWIKEASLGHYPLSGVKFRDFPASMRPTEVAKLVRMAPEMIKGGKARDYLVRLQCQLRIGEAC